VFFAVIPFNNLLVLWLGGQAYFVVYISLIIADDRHSGIFLSCTTMICAIIFQCMAALALVVVNREVTASEYVGVIANSICIIIALFLFCIPTMHRLLRMIISASFICKMIVLYSYILTLTFMLIYKFNMTSLYENIYIVIMGVILFCISNAAVVYYEQKISMKNQELAIYQKNLPRYEALISDIRASQHEFSNRLQTLEMLPQTCHTYEELCDALAKYTKTYAKPLHAYPLLQINLPLLAAALYNLSLRAESTGIIVKFDVASPQIHSKVPETELADYTSILLQNAIEACDSGDNIYIQMESSDSEFTFEIRNPVSQKYTTEELASFFSKGTSSKQKNHGEGSNHGLGLYYLNNQLHKNGGAVSVNCLEFSGKYWMIFKMRV
jgi:hypothetical protein